MIDAMLIGLEWTWNPGFRGLLTVVVAVAILCGSVYLILATNSGNRLGFLIALAGFCGWMTVMGIIWSLYGIGYKGAAPTWKVVDTVRTESCTGVAGSDASTCNFAVTSAIDAAESVPLPGQLEDEFGTPVDVRNASQDLLEAYPANQRDPGFTDLVTADENLKEDINDFGDPWRILEASNKYTGETQAVVGEDLGPNGQNLFASASDYAVINSWVTGGKPGRTDDSILARVAYKVTSTANVNPDEFYAVVQLQPVIPQETKPGQAPPAPVRDTDQEVITVVLKRVDGHLLRRKAITMTIVMGLTTALLCNSLHRRDKLAQAQRAATAGAS